MHGIACGTLLDEVNHAVRFVAERSWMLSEMLVLDLKDAAGVFSVAVQRRSNSLGHGKQTHAYMTEVAVGKKGLLVAFRSVAEDHAAKRRKEREGEHE